MIVRVDKIASSTATLRLGKEIDISDRIEVRAGNVLVVKALQEKSVYDKLELDTGRMAHISREDVIAGVLGRRRALKGFVGDLPEAIAVGDRLQILNLGGVIGVCVSGNKDLGTPLQVEVLGMAVRDGKPLNISEGAVPPRESLAGIPEFPPLVLVAGTCMAAGKTQAACEIVVVLAAIGFVAAWVLEREDVPGDPLRDFARLGGKAVEECGDHRIIPHCGLRCTGRAACRDRSGA